jgi:hypothetical protein
MNNIFYFPPNIHSIVSNQKWVLLKTKEKKKFLNQNNWKVNYNKSLAFTCVSSLKMIRGITDDSVVW